MRSLRTRVAVALVVAALLPVAVIGWRSVVATRQQAEALAEVELASAVRLTAIRIDGVVERYRELTRVIAESPAARAALREPSAAREAERALARILAREPGALSAIALFDAAGAPIASSGQAQDLAPFATPIGTAIQLRPMGDSLGLPTDLVFTAPVQSDPDAPLGVVALRLRADMLHIGLREAGGSSANRLVRLRERSGRPLASYPSPRIGGVRPVAVPWDSVSRGFSVTEETVRNNGVRLRRLRHDAAGFGLFEAAATLEHEPWYIAVSTEANAVLAPVRERTRMLLFELVAIAVLVTAVALVLGEGLSRRLIALRDVTRRFASGDRTARAPEGGTDELADLSRSVNAMATEIGSLVGSLEQRTAELEADIAERKRLEAQLVQARKLEAVGQLAGGVAHDYNNVLTVVMQAADGIAETVDPASPAAEDVRTLRTAAKRAADLTQQLLTFARRQTIEPRELDLNSAVRQSVGLLRGLLGGRHQLVVEEASRPLRVKSDPTQLTQVLLNLASNARDAFGDNAGTFRVSLRAGHVDVVADATAGTTPPTHAVLDVTDTGSGMDAETMTRIFEPFFTTKGPGRGTGLGLATVFGIVSQSGGTIAVDSTPGHGTTFRIALPLVA